MSTKFDWDSYEPSNAKQTNGSKGSAFDWNSYESDFPIDKGEQTFTESIPEIGKESVKGIARMGLRAGAALVSAPSKAVGGLLQVLSGIGAEGKPGEIKGAGTRMIKSAGDYFQKIGKDGQAQLRKGIENILGESYGSGEEAVTKFAERAADIYGRGPFKGMAIPAIAGGAAGQIAEELGAGEGTQQLAEMGGILGPDLARGVVSLAKQPRYSKSGLRLPSLAEKTGEKLRGVKAKVFPGKKQKLLKEISEQAEGVLAKIKSESLPISKEIEEGIDVTARNQKNLANVEKLGNKMTNKVESNLVSDYLNEIESKIQFGGIPTEEQEQILNLVNKYKSKYGITEGGTRFYTPGQYVKQFRNINKDLNRLYQTKFVHGERLETMGFYEGLKDKIEKTIEEGTPTAYSKLFKESNKEFSQLKRLERFEGIFESITADGVIDPKKLNNYVTSSRKANILRKQIGEEGFNKIKLISKDLSLVQNKLKLVGELGVGDLVKSATTFGVMKFLGVPFAKTAQITNKVTQLGRGYLLTSPQGARDVSNFLKAVKSGSKKAATRYLLKLDKNIQKYEEESKKSK